MNDIQKYTFLHETGNKTETKSPAKNQFPSSHAYIKLVVEECLASDHHDNVKK